MCGGVERAAGPRPALDVATIVRAHGHKLRSLTRAQLRVLRDIVRCRTAAAGGHVAICDRCEHREVHYDSCGNRHCPTCQNVASARWLLSEERSLLPVPYFHVIFTVPEALHPFFRRAPARAYGLLFGAAAQAILKVAKDPRHLGAEPGFTAALHTWTQQLRFHPHVHCVVTGGGLDSSGAWRACAPGFFLPKDALARVFAGTLLHALEVDLAKGAIRLARGTCGKTLLCRATLTDWVVDVRPPFAGPEQVLRYLSRYTHRIAISNERLLALEEGQVCFRWKDRRDHDRQKRMSLPAGEFLRRFLLHVLPDRFVRIRHYGLLANAARATKLARARTALAAPLPDSEADPPSAADLLFDLSGRDITRCPACHVGHLVLTEDVPPARDLLPLFLRGRPP